MPLTETYYHCKVFKFPKLSKKHHVIGVNHGWWVTNSQILIIEIDSKCIWPFVIYDHFQYRPLITKGSVPHIHHINVYNCHVPESVGRTADYLEKYVTDDGADCFANTTPTDWKEYCYALRLATAVGADGTLLTSTFTQIKINSLVVYFWNLISALLLGEMYPSHLGDPIGSEKGDDTYLLLEVHYENPYGLQCKKHISFQN